MSKHAILEILRSFTYLNNVNLRSFAGFYSGLVSIVSVACSSE
jgi:hypothetical protein